MHAGLPRRRFVRRAAPSPAHPRLPVHAGTIAGLLHSLERDFMPRWMGRVGAIALRWVRLYGLLAWGLCAGGYSAGALAWGVQGHQVVAAIAWQALSPAARQEAARLLGQEPGQTLVSVATWADLHRGPGTAPWHYLNFPRGQCHWDAERDCPQGQCVVGAIERQRAVLASPASDAERLQALKFLVHFVGDVHQPLHAGYRDDRGGNNVQLRFLMRGSNLHALWDKGLLEQLALDDAALTSLVQAQPLPGPRQAALSPVEMAEESCRIVALPGFYPQGDPSPTYVARMTPLLLQRLALAGQRLADLLNQALP